ncbi:hypothetical protein QR680_008810 [Steinernema hermaphroditum]|uniref:BAG family molecular chaperone regulator 1 n=1 Tax=Steinernema hermaphroditum TaxID=289476 RepID=A0AA39II04_9BILA|nr:hypothetical protein QR680_008810 [Steinernema hermaphroditum]
MTISLNCSCGGKQFQIPISLEPKENEENSAAPSESQDPSTIGDLLNAISENSGYSRKDLKVIWRGKTFMDKDSTRPLAEFKFKDNDKVMVLGRQKKGALTSDPGFSRLVDYEKAHLQKMTKDYVAIEKDLLELEKIMLDGDKMKEMCKKMDKRLKCYTEDGIRHMEKIDALEIYIDDATDEQKQRNREKRKSLINGIQDLLNKSDKFFGRVQLIQQRVENPELF